MPGQPAWCPYVIYPLRKQIIHDVFADKMGNVIVWSFFVKSIYSCWHSVVFISSRCIISYTEKNPVMLPVNLIIPILCHFKQFRQRNSIFLSTHTHTHTRTHTHTHACGCTLTTHTHTHKHTHTHAHTQIHTNTHTHTCTHTHAHTHTHTHTFCCLHILIHIYVCIHISIYWHILSSICLFLSLYILSRHPSVHLSLSFHYFVYLSISTCIFLYSGSHQCVLVLQDQNKKKISGRLHRSTKE